MTIVRVGVDIAKTVFQIHGVDGHGKARLKKTLSRGEMLEFLAMLPACLVGIEACAGAHYWARELKKFGHDVRLMAAQLVTPYRKGGKNDANDAEAICEAVGRPNMRFVPIKTRRGASGADVAPGPGVAGGRTHRLVQPDPRFAGRVWDCGGRRHGQAAPRDAGDWHGPAALAGASQADDRRAV